MKKLSCLIVLLLTCRICNAQNLVPNGDFEQFTSCPNAISQIDSVLFWSNPCLPPYANSGTGSGSPDYFNSCSTIANLVGVPSNGFGYQFPHSGNGYAGLIPYGSTIIFREYIEVSLLSPLISNTCYHIEMYVNLANNCQFTIDTIGVYFSSIAVTGFHSHDTLPYIPQLKINSGFILDTLNWTLLSGNYTATGGESYLTIGNFNSDTLTNRFQVSSFGGAGAYLYFDDVSLCPCSNPCITDIQEHNENAATKIYPNPINKKLNVVVNNNNLYEIILYDIASRRILQQKFTNSVSLNTEQLAKGIYIYEVRSKNGSCKKGKVVKD